jgi:Domain of unknown function (DUF4129)
VSRAWNTLAGIPIDWVGAGLLLLIVLAGAVLIGAAWHWFPAWLPRSTPFRGMRWAGLAFWRWRWRRPKRAATASADAVDVPVAAEVETLPDLPARTFLSRADQYAAEGRYDLAVRERLRAIVRSLVDRGVMATHPDWTVTELARAAAAARAALSGPLDGANTVFADIWYGQRVATVEHDTAMREYAAQVSDVLRVPVGAGR